MTVKTMEHDQAWKIYENHPFPISITTAAASKIHGVRWQLELHSTSESCKNLNVKRSSMRPMVVNDGLAMADDD